MSSINKAIIVGRVGRDPEIRHMQSGKSVVNLSIATTSKRKDANGNNVEDTQWHRVTAYDKLADIIGQYVHKGSLIYIEGSIKYGKFTDKDGVERNTTDIVAGQMQMLGGKGDGGGDERPQRRQEAQQELPEEDLPF